MYWSKYFIPTLKEIPTGTEAVSHQLSLRAGLVHMLTSGVYSYLPLGYKVLSRVENIIREEMDAIGCHELLMPALHPIEIWKKTGRDVTLKEVMITFDNKKGQRMCLGPTHEEIITDLAKHFVKSYRQLPVTLYQIQTKFRDEIHTRFGIVRACEFIMKDAYSFDRDTEGLKKNYDLQLQAYTKIFKRCGLDVIVVSADSGAMGGSVSHEFLVAAPIGEDAVWVNKNDGQAIKDEEGKAPKGDQWERKIAIELGHVFQLGTKYSESLGALFLDENGEQKPMIMGCYGIGVSRLIAAIIEVNNDANGIMWPQEVAPFDVEILPVQAGDEIALGLAKTYYKELKSAGLDVLLDDRDESAGRKFNDADLIGIPLRIIIGKRMLANNQVEIKIRRSGQVIAVDKDKVKEEILKVMAIMTLDEIQQRIEILAKPVIEALGADLIELKVGGHKNDVLVQITADKPNGGITIRECAILNKAVVAAIEQENVLPPEIFSLELSSPGLDRPLVVRKDFLRLVGKNLHFWLNEPVRGKKEVQGVLTGVGESSLTIDASGNVKLVLPLISIIKGMLVI